jgi:hypothetical protein
MALDVFEEESRTAGFARAAVGFRDAVGDLGNFEDGIDGFADAAELAGLIEEFNPVSEVVAGQGISP